MLVEPHTTPSAEDGRGRLRAAALHLGALLGWQAHEVAAFAQALCGRPFENLGPPELERVIEEYREIGIAIAARVRRGRHKRRREPRGHQD